MRILTLCLLLLAGCARTRPERGLQMGAGRWDSHVGQARIGYVQRYPNCRPWKIREFHAGWTPRFEIDDPKDGFFPNKSPRAGDNADLYAFEFGGELALP